MRRQEETAHEPDTRCEKLPRGVFSKRGAMDDFDWAGFLGDRTRRTHDEFSRMYAEVAVMHWAVLRARRLRTPSLLLDGVPTEARWTGKDADRSPLALRVRRCWPTASLAVGIERGVFGAAPEFTEYFFQLVNQTVTWLFEPARTVILIRAAKGDHERFRGYLWTLVRNRLYDLHRANDPKTYNIYENVRCALGIAWCTHHTLNAEGSIDRPVVIAGKLPRGRLLLALVFVSARHPSPLTPRPRIDREELSRRIGAQTSGYLLPEVICKDSADGRAHLARLLPDLIQDRALRGSVLRDAILAWVDTADPGRRSIAPSVVEVDDERAATVGPDRDPSSFRQTTEQLEQVRLATAKACAQRGVAGVLGAEILFEQLYNEGEVISVNELHEILKQQLALRGLPVTGRSTAGEIHLLFTTAARKVFSS